MNHRTAYTSWPVVSNWCLTKNSIFCVIYTDFFYSCTQLEPCVKRVIELDKNNAAYRKVLNEPFIHNHDIISGFYLLCGVTLANYALRHGFSCNGYGESCITIELSFMSRNLLTLKFRWCLNLVILTSNFFLWVQN